MRYLLLQLKDTRLLKWLLRECYMMWQVEGRNLAIAQASKALNWCKALVGFSDSTEYIECERILLIESKNFSLPLYCSNHISNNEIGR